MESACNEGGGGNGGGGGSGGAAGANGGPCSLSNGWCTRSCTCAGCEVECTGNPPASENGHLCNLDYCSLDYWSYGGCEIKDGACNYRVECIDSPKIIGTCPNSN
ncbi:MAG TPA: hypothetical protein VM694_13915 [Polyangium sp.]|nr:hypothetical protein [Polyangium sp.]